MSDRWYYRLLGEEFGPVTSTELEDLVDVGTLDQSDEIRLEASNAWQKISTALSAVGSSGSPSASAEDTAAGDLNIDDFVFDSSDAEDSAAADDPQRLTALDDLSFEFADSGETAELQKQRTHPELPAYQPLPTIDPPDAESAPESPELTEPPPPKTPEPKPAPETTGDTDPSVASESETVISDPKPRRPKKRKAGPKKKRPKKKKPREDEELDDIFDEVFSEEEPAPPKVPPAVVPSAAVTNDAPPAAASVPPPAATPSRAARPFPVSPPKPKKKKSSGGFSLPDPKLMLGAVAALALIGVGWWAVGEFGSGFGSVEQQIETDPGVQRLMERLDNLKTVSPDDAGWEDFETATLMEGPILIEMIAQVDNPSPKTNQARFVAQALMTLAETGHADQSVRDTMVTNLRLQHDKYKSM